MKKVITLIIIVMMIGGTIYYINFREDDDSIDCNSAFSIINDDEVFSFSVTFFTKNGNGLITFSGNSGNARDNIIIRKYFSYTKNKSNIYIFKNNNSNMRTSSPAFSEKFDDIFPPFFTEISKEDNFIIKIIKVKSDAWVLMSTNTPYFVCENTRA
ncbi:hypothetical protein QFI91_05390 [Raoultella sp. WB_B2P2-3]|uniref:FidL-like membrane protein n=1 Tax=Raoultella scottii TaxID=3040937 RepID=A0ABU8Z1U7_9ENTR|nr:MULTISPECIES: hypothetical protein [Enterobacteriaceae]